METVDIYNKALAAIGLTRFLSLATSTFPEAVHCRREWEAARKTVLGAHDWGWLAEDTPYCAGEPCYDNSDSKPTYTYPRPDCIMIAAVMDADGRRVKWTPVNQLIKSSVAVARIRYVPDSEVIDDWPIPVQDAVAYELASRIAFPLLQDANIMKAMKALAVAHLSSAMTKDSAEVRFGGTNGRKYADARN